MVDLPRGTVTFLFTDIEGSTKLLSELGSAYVGVLEEHRTRLRRVFANHGGIEVSTEGDAFFVVFERASAAVQAAVEGQKALDGMPVKVRVGVHTGEPVPASEGYAGMDLHRAARLGDAGHGGQILLSNVTASLAAYADTVDLGDHRLKDVGIMHIFQVGSTSFPPLRTLSQTNIISPSTPLIGRDQAVASILDLFRVSGTRLVTLRGPAGVGKSRLAQDVALALAPGLPQGAWFVDLAPVRDPEMVEASIAVAIGAGGPLTSYLADRTLLLVLDNFEQVIEAAETVSRLLECAPGLRFMVTSREPLQLRGEREFLVEPLDVDDASRLFADRAASVGCVMDSAMMSSVSRVCERLDGIPLAIELAAARTTLFTPDQLLARLDNRFAILTGGPRDVPVRQRTLRSALEWSYDLLNADERKAFAGFSVFAGGCGLEAAEEVCADVETLQSLVDKSLIRREGERLRMLESIHHFGRECLNQLDHGAEFSGRHAAYFVDYVRLASPGLTGEDQRKWLLALDAEQENLRQAMTWLLSQDPSDDRILPMVGGLTLYWFVHGAMAEGIQWLSRALENFADQNAPAVGQVMWGAGFMSAFTGDFEKGVGLLERSLEVGRRANDLSLVARALDVLGLLSAFRNDLEGGCRLLEESIDFAGRAGDHYWLADAMGTLASLFPLMGQFDRGEALAKEALGVARRHGDRQGVRMALFALGLTEARQGRMERARRLSEEGMAVSLELGDLWFESYFAWLLATIALEDEDAQAAAVHAAKSLKIARNLEAPLLLICALNVTGAIAVVTGNLGEAGAAYHEAAAIGRSGQVPLAYFAETLYGLGQLAFVEGRSDEGRRLIRECVEAAGEVGDTLLRSRAVALDTSRRDYE